jgi:predicted Zn-dependent protease
LDRRTMLGRGSRANTLLHELGHVVGLGHSIEASDVMCNCQGRVQENVLSLQEQIALKMK